MIDAKKRKLLLGDILPNFQGKTQFGDFDFYSYIENNWVMLFSHPKDFTPRIIYLIFYFI